VLPKDRFFSFLFLFTLGADPNVMSLLELSAKASDQDKRLLADLIDFTPDENINMEDKETGMTLLHAAASISKHMDIKKILNKKANIMAEDKNGRLPLELAVKNRNSKSSHYGALAQKSW
jgi:ankyrin repeat protein